MRKKEIQQTENNLDSSALVEKVCILEQRIKELKTIFMKEKNQFLDEDLKARGLK